MDAWADRVTRRRTVSDLHCRGATEGRCESCDGAIGNIPLVAGNRGTKETQELLESLKFRSIQEPFSPGVYNPEKRAFNAGIDKAITALKIVGVIPKH